MVEMVLGEEGQRKEWIRKLENFRRRDSGEEGERREWWRMRGGMEEMRMNEKYERECR